MKFTSVLASTLIVGALLVGGGSSLPMPAVYGANAQPCQLPPHSYVANRVGIYPTTPVSSHYESSNESSEEHPTTVDHYKPPKPAPKDKHCPEKLLPVSICVQLPPDAPMKLSKNLLQQIVFSLVQDPVRPHLPAKTPYPEPHKQPCEYPKKPCECTKKPYTPPKEHPCTTPKPYTPPCETTPKPCYTPPKDSYEPPKSTCETPVVKPTYKPHKPTYGGSAEVQSSYEPVKKPYVVPEPYTPPKEYPRVQYGGPKEPCATTVKPCYKPTTPAPCTTTSPRPTPCPTHPTGCPYATATYAPYTAQPRYPSIQYNNTPNYPKPPCVAPISYEPQPKTPSSCGCKDTPVSHPLAPTYPKPPKKSCGCAERHRQSYNYSG
uniref:Uncharacterized protein n=1 Tax=Anopheles farauti TaxID=69004 RepID=A0A182QZC0_9DIPT